MDLTIAQTRVAVAQIQYDHAKRDYENRRIGLRALTECYSKLANAENIVKRLKGKV